MVVFSVLVLLFAGISVGAGVYVQHPKFGMPPEGDRLAIVEKSPNYANGEFRNRIATPMFADGNSFASVVVSSLLSRQERLKPSAPLPSVKTDLRTLNAGQDTVVHDLHGLLLPGLLCRVRRKYLFQCRRAFSQSAFAHLRITRRHGARGMAKAPLCQIKVVGAFVKVRGETVPQGVKGDFLLSVSDALV